MEIRQRLLHVSRPVEMVVTTRDPLLLYTTGQLIDGPQWSVYIPRLVAKSLLSRRRRRWGRSGRV